MGRLHMSLLPETIRAYDGYLRMVERENAAACAEWDRFPRDVEAERALVWWAHHTPDVLSPRQISAEAFTDPACARRWRILQQHNRLTHPIDLTELARHDGIPLGPAEALRRVRACWTRRQLLDAAARLAEAAFDVSVSTERLRMLARRAEQIVGNDARTALLRAVVDV